jgi:hypothetical protein
MRYLGFGLAPLWIAIAIVLGGSGANWWAAAPWLIFYSIPCCGVSLAIVAFVSWATRGSEKLSVTPNREREMLISTLTSVHAGLMKIPEGVRPDGAEAQFMNASSDLLSQQRISALGRHGALDQISQRVEAALHVVKSAGLTAREKSGLLVAIESTIQSLQ